MTVKVNAIVQFLGMLVQVLNATEFPTEWKPWVALFVAIIQAVSAILAHYNNPDGTPASVAFVGKVKQ